MANSALIYLQLEFSGGLIPIGANELGQQVVPLKPLTLGVDYDGTAAADEAAIG